jgi:hypothetical protein
MGQILFIVSLFLVVLIALEMEVVLVPNIIFLVLGSASLIFGLFFIGFGNFRKRRDNSDHPSAGLAAPSGDKKSKGSSACLSTVVGSMYVFLGIGIITLQLIGHFYLR